LGLFTGDKLTAFTFSHSAQIDAIYTVYSATQIKAFFDSRGTDLQTKHNALIDDLALIINPTSGSIASINGVSNAGGDITLVGGASSTASAVITTDTAAKTITITPSVATTTLNNISMIGQALSLVSGPGSSSLTLNITADTAAQTITFTVNGTALPAAHAATHAVGNADDISLYYRCQFNGGTIYSYNNFGGAL